MLGMVGWYSHPWDGGHWSPHMSQWTSHVTLQQQQATNRGGLASQYLKRQSNISKTSFNTMFLKKIFQLPFWNIKVVTNKCVPFLRRDNITAKCYRWFNEPGLYKYNCITCDLFINQYINHSRMLLNSCFFLVVDIGNKWISHHFFWLMESNWDPGGPSVKHTQLNEVAEKSLIFSSNWLKGWECSLLY